MRANKISAVVFDWAGTIVDFGSCAPMGAFVKLFEKFKIPLTIDEARGPMGTAKLDHIKSLLALKNVEEAWIKVYGNKPSDADAQKLYDVFIPMNVQAIDDYSEAIDGAAELFKKLRENNIKIGSTTGYNREIIEKVMRLAKPQGIVPDSVMCAGDFKVGRPAPFMMFETFNRLEIWHPYTVVKVDDTAVGIKEGLNAGTWTVGVTTSGNEVGLTKQAWLDLPDSEKLNRRQKAEQTLRQAGAHYVIKSVADLWPVLLDIEQKIQQNQRPE